MFLEINLLVSDNSSVESITFVAIATKVMENRIPKNISKNKKTRQMKEPVRRRRTGSGWV